MYSNLAVARRYADALFEAAQESEAILVVEEDLAVLLGLVKDPKIELVFKKPSEAVACGKVIVDAMKSVSDYQFSPITQNFVTVLFENERSDLFEEVIDAFSMLVNLSQNREKIVVETAVPLDEVGKAKFIAKITGDLGDSFYFEFKEVKDLIGGYRIVFRSKVLDATIKNRVDRLSRMIKL